MDYYSKETLRIVEENDDTLTELGICGQEAADTVLSCTKGRLFTSRDGDDYSRLGSSIGRNTNLTEMFVELEVIKSLSVSRGFYNGIKQNSSIQEFKLSGFSSDPNNDVDFIRNPVGDVGCELLRSFENSSQLTALHIFSCDIRNAEERVIINTTLGSCTNLKTIYFNFCNMTDEQLLPMVDAIRGHSSLQKLSLHDNMIGNAGCEALATLLEDPSCNLQDLDLSQNQIGNDGGNAIINSLASNTKLTNLNLSDDNQMENQSDVVNAAVVRLLCNSESINSIYSSNHTLETLVLSRTRPKGIRIASLLELNRGTNKGHTAIKKILKYNPNIDMEPLFEWGFGDEQSVKALPYVVAWFDRARVVVEQLRSHYHYQFDTKNLAAIYQFALAMPLLFIPASHIKTDDKKRKGIGM